MELITIDFETYYDKEFSLSKMTTEAYVRDPRFEPILCGVHVHGGTPFWAAGREKIQTLLDSLAIEQCVITAHNAHFDGLILNHHFGHRPKAWLDTLSMARAVHGVDVGGSLSKLLKHYAKLADEGKGPRPPVQKGDYVVQALGKHLADFTWEELCAYAKYCGDDCEGTTFLAEQMTSLFPRSELRFMDRIIRMFTEPTLLLDEAWLREYARDIEANKITMLFEAGVTREEVMSNDKFAAALERLGITPPQKISPTTGKPTYAFAKTDRAMETLAEHEDDRVQALVAARLGNKSTINETRALRMASMATRGPACLYYKYAGALQTMRVSGGDKLNWQNMPRVEWDNETDELKTGHLRMSVFCAPGYRIVVCDSANIEARVLDWLAGQEDLLEVYRRADRGEGPDVYCVLATELFGKEVTKADKTGRNVGKYIKLGCGFGMGPPKFIDTVRIQSRGKLKLDLPTSSKYVGFYRERHPMVVQLWNRAKSALPILATGPSDESDRYIDARGILRVDRHKIILPNGLPIKYPGLQFKKADPLDPDAKYGEWSFITRRNPKTDAVIEHSRLYGGKMVENIVQALAKIIVVDQAGEVTKQYRGVAQEVMTTHDEGAWVVPEDRADEVLAYAIQAFSVPPSWAPDLPLSAEGSHAVRYGEAK